MSLVVKAKLKEHTDLNVAGNVAEALSAKVEELIKKGTERAKANGRKTLMAHDL